ncbi:MAG: CinA family nicotinamide mononucleotide deamidase-related protein [Bacteroidales bacterium]|nr:CinA family nicotinamide mononucleotide deamidase-related protein [Bacteroidales bacterium]
MNVSIINIGDELLIGQVVNSNASTMSKMLIAAGMDVREVATIPDVGKSIRETLERCLASTQAVLITGGLGPTKDDITKKTLCDYFHSELYENEEALANVKRIFDSRGYELTPINRQQAWVPRCCTMINNYVGTAPCMWFETEDKVVVSMPGVPFEMEWLMENEIVARLRQHFHCDYILNKNLLVQGIGESFLSDLIESWELALPASIRLAYLPQAGMVKLRLTARGADEELLKRQIADAVSKLYPIAGQYIVGEDLETLPELVAYTLKKAGKTLATAESCTGGTIASKLTALAGASEYFKGGIVAYSNEVKEISLGVKHETLKAHGAVSEETVREMVMGVRERLHSDYAVATTGVAGPGGGTPEKPVGTVWIGIASKDQVIAKKMKYGDRRAQTIERTCNEVFSSLVKMVKCGGYR